MSKNLQINNILSDVRDFITANGLVDAGEIRYFDNQSGRYKFLIERLADIENTNEKNLLDVGSHLLHFAIAARIIGYHVYGSDVSYHLTIPQTIRRQNHFNICVKECDLSLHTIPFDDVFFDTVNFAETLEHLPFNPIPPLKEIRRVLKPGGTILLTTPNIARLGNRVKLLQGKNIYTSLDEFCSDVNYGVHFREYTFKEVAGLLEKAGFVNITGQTLYFHRETGLRSFIKQLIEWIVPSFSGNLFFKAQK